MDDKFTLKLTHPQSYQDWNVIDTVSIRGYLANYLKTTLRDWYCVDLFGKTLVHYASRSDKNISALIMLYNAGVDIHRETFDGWTALTVALNWKSKRSLEILIALNVPMIHSFMRSSSSPFHIALQDDFCVDVFLSNGIRLSSVVQEYRHYITSNHIKFEQGVMCCRDIVVTLLGLKRFRKILPKLDRFLIQQELAVAVWSTRSITPP